MNSKTYLGYIDIIENTHVNFYPIYEYTNSKFIKIENAEKIFSEYENIRVFFKDKYECRDKYIKNKEFCIIELEESDLKNYETSTGINKRIIHIEDLIDKRKIHTLEEYNLYPIVSPINSKIDFSKDNIILVNENFPISIYMTKSILLYNGEYYGPFKTECRTHDNKIYINTKIKENKYLIQKLNIIDQNEDPIIYCDYKRYNNYENQFQYKDFFHILNNIETETIDVANDNILIENFLETLKYFETETEKKQFLDLLEKTNIYSTLNIKNNEKINKNRENRLIEIFKNFEKIKNLTNIISETLQIIFAKTNNKEEQNEIINNIISNPIFLNGIQNYKVISRKINEEQEKLNILKKENDEIEENLQSKKEEYEKSIINNIENKTEEIKTIEQEILKKQEELDIITEKLSLTQDIQTLYGIHEHYNNQIKSFENKIDEKIKLVKNEIASLNFDNEFNKLISQKMTEQIFEQQKNIETEIYQKLSKDINNITIINDKTEKEYIDYIIKEIQKYRPLYDKNTILNILICICQNFLTIFSGAPGTGKTSICKILSNVLGLDKQLIDSTKNTSRFSIIAVEKGWNSKRDLIGYYNPLSKQIEKNNNDFFDALSILNAENKNSKFPMFFLLDEANLSPIEFYWADFVNISDNITNNSENLIDLGNGHKFFIPHTTRFLATINNDHTVEKISPRLIDRSFIISLPYEYSNNVKNDFTPNEKIIDWNTLYKIFGKKENNIEKEAQIIFDNIKKQFEAMNHPISPRVENMIISYCSTAQDLFETKANIAPSIIALDYAISQKIITKISGSGEEYKKKIIELKEYCQSQNLNKTTKHLEEIINYGDNEFLGNYDFFN